MMMKRYLIITCLSLLSSCAALGVDINPLIEFQKAEKIKLKMFELFPDYKDKSEARELIELTISSDVELLTLSIENSTTLKASIGLCRDGKHIPELAFNSVFFKGKTIEYYLINGLEPRVKDNTKFQYQLYLNYAVLESQIKTRDTLCAEIKGSSYGSSFSSNVIELPLVIDK
ncbi:hypothetical protein [Pseudoalteromonas piscicida]|uniref:hypothetical protein n=1 Tax=Pseudoalteromonas piscicida TaxID=43662 RepID=UPI0030B499FC